MYLVTGFINYISPAAGNPVLVKYTGNFFGLPATVYSLTYTATGIPTEYNAVFQQYIPIFEDDVCAIQVILGAITQVTIGTYFQFQLIQEFI